MLAVQAILHTMLQDYLIFKWLKSVSPADLSAICIADVKNKDLILVFFRIV